MKIIIDARFWGIRHTGLGRYTKNIIPGIIDRGKEDTFIILLNTSVSKKLTLPDNVKRIPCDIPHYSLREQTELPKLIDSLAADLLYSPHLNIPILLRTPYILTIHDLIKSHFTGKDTTTKSPALFAIKRLAYKMVIQSAIKRARAIVVPSIFVKDDLLGSMSKDEKKIHVVYEAPDEIFTKGLSLKREHKIKKSLIINHSLPKSYLLYVGNAYPHKNLKNLIQALRQLKGNSLKLVVVSKNNVFIKRIFSTLSISERKNITLMEGINDQELFVVYKNATLTVIPSLMEGFGLVGVESLAIGTPIAVADIPVFHEVYKNRAIYFDPLDIRAISKAITGGIKTTRLKWNYQRTWHQAGEEIYEILKETSNSL